MLHKLLRTGTRKSAVSAKYSVVSVTRCRILNRQLTSAAYTPDLLGPIFGNDNDGKHAERWQEEEGSYRESKAKPKTSLTFDPSYLDGVVEPCDVHHRTQEQVSAKDRRLVSRDTALRTVGAKKGLFQRPEHSLSVEERQELATTEGIKNIQDAIMQTLDGGESDELLQKVWEASHIYGAIASIPSTTFVEILRRLDTCDDFLPFRHGYVERYPKTHRLLAPQHKEAFEVFQRRRKMYWDICQKRVYQGRNLEAREYTQLLKCARGTWDGRTASTVMMSMLNKGLKPDLECYNMYFEAICWSDTWHPQERQSLRVIPHTARWRQDTTKRQLHGGIYIHPHNIGENGLKSEINMVFTHMIEDGIMADGKAFSALLTALGREGDMQGVKAVLLKAWDVDVDAMDSQVKKESTDLPRSSPLYPTQDLLFSIAHAFASNNDVPTALAVVDHFSRRFSIPISQAVWAELLEWAFTLSTARRKARKTDGAQLGQLSSETVEHLWHVATSEPYNCEPSIPICDILIRSMRRRDRLFPMLEYIFQGWEIHLKDLTELRNHARCASARHLDNYEHRSQELRTKRFASFAAVHYWFGLLISGQRWLSKHFDNRSRILFWERQLLPDVVGFFWRFRNKSGVEYTMETGRINLQEDPANMTVERKSPTKDIEYTMDTGRIHLQEDQANITVERKGPAEDVEAKRTFPVRRIEVDFPLKWGESARSRAERLHSSTERIFPISFERIAR